MNVEQRNLRHPALSISQTVVPLSKVDVKCLDFNARELYLYL